MPRASKKIPRGTHCGLLMYVLEYCCQSHCFPPNNILTIFLGLLRLAAVISWETDLRIWRPPTKRLHLSKVECMASNFLIVVLSRLAPRSK
jgi:hypothetical protein